MMTYWLKHRYMTRQNTINEDTHMPKIIGCNIDGVEELRDDCPHKDTLDDCRVYRNMCGAVVVRSDD